MILSKNKIERIDPDNLLNDFISQAKLDEILIIVPTNRKIRYLKRELVSQSPGKSLSKINLHTFETFTNQIFQLDDFHSFKTLSEASSAVLLNKSFKKTELKYFSNYKNEIPRGTLDRIKNVITQYKLNGISPEQIISESKKLEGSEKLKATDIANIYKNYLAYCKELNVYETGDVYSEVLLLDIKNFTERFNKSFSGIKKILINGFDEFTQLEIDIINRAAEIEGIELYVIFDYYRYNPALFSHLDNCYEKFKAKGFIEVEDKSPIQFNDYKKRIREKLFLLNENDSPKPSKIETVKIIAQSPEEEIRLIAKEIKSLITKKNVDVDSITVAFNLISDHSAIFRDVFNEYAIPFNLTDRYALNESQPVIALINFLEILENNFYYKNIFRALTGRWIKINGLDLSNLLRVSSNLKIVSGYKNWIDSISRTIDEINYNNEDEDNRFLPIEFYSKAKEDVEAIFEMLKPFREKKSIYEFKDELRKLIYTLNLPQRIVNDHEDYIEKNVKAVSIFLETLDELFDLLADENGTDKKFPLGYFLSQIKTALQFTRYNIKERHASGVLVTSVNEIRGLNFDYVFIGGLVDGEFPTRYQPEIFLSGSYKKDEYRHILEDRYHFYQTLCCAKKRLYLSYAMKDEKKEFTPSTFVNDLLRLFSVKEKSSKDYSELVYSKSELMKYAATLDLEKDLERLETLGINAEKLKTDLSVDKLRLEDPFGETEFTGNISINVPEEAKTKLAEQAEKQYSASQLEEYAKCPFQYFLKRLLQLETIEEPTEELESFELGSIIHSILYEFYSTIKEKDIILSRCDEATFKQAEKLIFSIAEKKIEKLRLNSTMIFFEREKILGIAGNKKKSILYKFLEEERNNSEGFIPQYFELGFGKFKDSKDDDASKYFIGNVRVRGKIDRIDVKQDDNKFKIIDYKLSGKKPTKKDLETGLSLQLPLYLYASKKLIEAEMNKEYNPAAAVIYSLKLNNKEFGEKLIHISSSRSPGEDELLKSTEELIKICSEFIPAYVKNIVEGKFNLSTLEDRENKVCRFCDFKAICRIQEAG
jgi:ATP-dependent helicase/nuclease subunit B